MFHRAKHTTRCASLAFGLAVVLAAIAGPLRTTTAAAATIDGATLNLDEAGILLRAPSGAWNAISSSGDLRFRCQTGPGHWALVTLFTRSAEIASADDALAALTRTYTAFDETLHSRSNDKGPEPRRLAGVQGWYHAYNLTQSKAEVHAWIGWRGGYLVTLVCGSPTAGDSFSTDFYNSVAGSMRSDGTWKAPADPAHVPAPELTRNAGGASSATPPSSVPRSTPDSDDDADDDDSERNGTNSSSGGGGQTMMLAVIGVLVLGGVVALVVVSGRKGGNAGAGRQAGRRRNSGGGNQRGGRANGGPARARGGRGPRR